MPDTLIPADGLAEAAGLEFTKGHGAANDFIAYSDPAGTRDLSPATVAALCDRHRGIGADGLLRAVRSAIVAPDNAAAGATWFMDYRNADGSIAEMCGNGVRVFVAYLLAEGLAELPDDGVLLVGTRAGIRVVRRSTDGFEVDLGSWHRQGDPATGVDDEIIVGARGLDVARPGLGISVGNPHVVVALAELAELDRLDLSEAPALDPAPAAGANVEFVVPADPLIATDGVGEVSMRVHERGSGETLACGTGAAAAALAIRHWSRGASDMWRVTVPGGVLGVRVVEEADGEHVHLSGPAVLVARGTVAS